jgi:hypothetical protein
MNTLLSSENFRLEMRVLFGFSGKPTSKLLSCGKITITRAGLRDWACLRVENPHIRSGYRLVSLRQQRGR